MKVVGVGELMMHAEAWGNPGMSASASCGGRNLCMHACRGTDMLIGLLDTRGCQGAVMLCKVPRRGGSCACEGEGSVMDAG
jgi:hypothetical protein